MKSILIWIKKFRGLLAILCVLPISCGVIGWSFGFVPSLVIVFWLAYLAIAIYLGSILIQMLLLGALMGIVLEESRWFGVTTCLGWGGLVIGLLFDASRSVSRKFEENRRLKQWKPH